MLQGPTMPRKVKFKCQDSSHARCCSSEVPEHSSASADAHLEASLPADTEGGFCCRVGNQLAPLKIMSIKVQQLPAQICNLRFSSRDPVATRDQKDMCLFCQQDRNRDFSLEAQDSCYPREILVCGCKDTLVLAGHFPQSSRNS